MCPLMAAVAGSDPSEVDGSQRLKLLDVGHGHVLRELAEAVLTQLYGAVHRATTGVPRDELSRGDSWFSGMEPWCDEVGCLLHSRY